MGTIVSALGALVILAGLGIAVLGGTAMVFAPHLIIGGVFLVGGLLIERWRYKDVLHRAPDPSWRDTGERFVDVETNLLTAVWLDPQGERHYLAVSPRRPGNGQ
ncbi:MAG: hypothetical protein FWD68_16800 [Alphaproteobacteria bacterium]|nr:hypothetical protein [Alphaproteobacteria bacterium]